ncbi:MAG: helix-turn-helix transcriptional regulator [Deltaproteobacteria bacterium]|nr:helix-turn-helix transcriptional regulator [Deltaproteobacteria bacterium]MBI3390926.1 helix-turn-helix transcriptional regulator [Deltaproteobacteria bacterium]
MTHLLGERVRALRQSRGLRVADVAAAAGITASQLSRIERGLITADDALIRRLAASLDPSCEDELLLLAGRLPPDLQTILQTHPAESALLLREHFGTATTAATPAAGVPVVPAQLVTAITQWAIRTADDVVLDPSCGDGAFVAAAAARLIELGRTPPAALNQIHGYDADTEACARATRRLREVTGSAARQIQRLAFLRVESPARLPFHRSGPPAVTVVLGAIEHTEPARRRHATAATARAHARRVAAEAGIALPDTAPPWAALVIHAASFVRPGGRLALIVPAAMVHAHYAADVRSYVAQLFPALTVATFTRPLPGFGEVAALLGDAAGDAGVRTRRVNDAAELTAALATTDSDARVAEPTSLRWSGASLPTPGRALLRELQRDGVLRRLGDLVHIDSGIVSGANHFFQLTAARAAGIDPTFLRPLLPTANANPGLIVHAADWEAWRNAGKPSFLLTIPPAAKLNRATRAYLDDGERQGLPARATCRRRPVWYVLPRTPAPAALLTYLCGRLPRMLLNDASVTHVNALHSVRPRAGVNTAAVAASFLNTAALLGCELLGRHMGNGVLKLEPAEVENLLVAYPPHLDDGERTALLDEADALWRTGRADDAIALGDRTVLQGALGVEASVLDKLRRCYESERDRRCAPARVRTAALNEVEI